MAYCEFLKLNGSENWTEAEAEKQVWRLEDTEAMQKLPAILVIVVVLLVGIFGNILVCIVYHYKFSPSTSKYFIMSLAIFDLLSCTIALPGEIVDLRFDYHFNFPTVCRIMRFTITLSTCSSVNLLIGIAVDRYKKICRPFEPQMSFKDTKRWMGVAVGIALVVALPAIPLYGRRSGEIAGVVTSDCSFDEKYRGTLFTKIYLGITGILCLSSFVVLIILYILIVIKVRNQRKKRKSMLSQGKRKITSSTGSLSEEAKKTNLLIVNDADNNGEVRHNDSSFDLNKIPAVPKERTKSQQKQTIKTTVMLFLVTIVFIISFIPHFVLQILNNYSGYVSYIHCNTPAMVAFRLFLRSYFINCASNPIIYSFFNDKFRTECQAFLSRLCCRSSACRSRT